MVEKVKKCEIGEDILQTLSLLNRCTLSRETVGVTLISIFFVDISVQNTIFRKYYLANELYIYFLSFLPGCENNLRARHRDPEEPAQGPALFASCLSLASEPFFLINLKKMY